MSRRLVGWLNVVIGASVLLFLLAGWELHSQVAHEHAGGETLRHHPAVTRRRDTARNSNGNRPRPGTVVGHSEDTRIKPAQLVKDENAAGAGLHQGGRTVVSRADHARKEVPPDNDLKSASGVWLGCERSAEQVSSTQGSTALPTDTPALVVLANGLFEVVIESNCAKETPGLSFRSVRNLQIPDLPQHPFRKGVFLMGLSRPNAAPTDTAEEVFSGQCTVVNLTVGWDSTTGRQIVNQLEAHFSCPKDLAFQWVVRLERGQPYATSTLRWGLVAAEGRRPDSLLPAYLVMLQMSSAGATVLGTVLGSPFAIAPSRVYLGTAHPLGASGIMSGEASTAVCAAAYLPAVIPGGGMSPGLSVVMGGYTESNQLRREFAEYIDATRASPVRPMLHYNSWFDFSSWQEPNASLHYRNMSEAICLDRVQQFGEELVRKRGVQLDSFLWDDGWDRTDSLWEFDRKKFPHEFDTVGAAAAKYGTGIGVWLSPWGGYGEAKESRLAAAREHGYETSVSMAGEGFSLSGKKYFKRFHEIMLSMVTRFGVNMFKVDGIGFEGNHTVVATEMQGMLSLVRELRESSTKPLFVSLTTGTWPSPFWLQHGDTIWRGHGDLGLEGQGSRRQMWITYRDAVVFHLVHRKAPMFPLSGLMLHGIVVGAVGQSRVAGLGTIDSLPHFEEEVWTYFSMGVQLQELYLSPDRMTPDAWDVVATAAKWARHNRHILADAHWVGGDPLGQVYGFGSWNASAEAGILMLRNPALAAVTVTLKFSEAFELPTLERGTLQYAFSKVYNGGGSDVVSTISAKNSSLCARTPPCVLDVDLEVTLRLEALQVVVLQGQRSR